MRRCVVLALAIGLASCASRRPPPPPAHSGWTLRYTQRVGEGSAPPRDVRPDVAMAVLDGRARMTVGGNEGRVDHPGRHADLCRTGVCAAVAYDLVLATLNAVEELPEARGLLEDAPSSESLTDPLDIVNVPTTGARFVGTVHGNAGLLRVTVEARWIESSGDPSVEVVKDFFLAPLERIGARQLATRIRDAIGLPLHWEVRMQQAHPDGSVAEGAAVFHAAELGNTPAAL